MTYIKQAKQIAIDAHSSVNQKYDGYLPYQFHLEMVARNVRRYYKKDDIHIIESAAWLHDVLEDTHLSYNDLYKSFSGLSGDDSMQVCEIVFAVTNNKGRNRAERANDAYYEGIRNTYGAVFVKLCDRLANVEYGVMTDSSMLKMHKKEWSHFYKSLGEPTGEIVDKLKNILEDNSQREV